MNLPGTFNKKDCSGLFSFKSSEHEYNIDNISGKAIHCINNKNGKAIPAWLVNLAKARDPGRNNRADWIFLERDIRYNQGLTYQKLGEVISKMRLSNAQIVELLNYYFGTSNGWSIQDFNCKDNQYKNFINLVNNYKLYSCSEKPKISETKTAAQTAQATAVKINPEITGQSSITTEPPPVAAESTVAARPGQLTPINIVADPTALDYESNTGKYVLMGTMLVSTALVFFIFKKILY